VRPVRIALLGDRQPGYPKHDLIQPALEQAASYLGLDLSATWIAPSSWRQEWSIAEMDGVFVAPQSHEYCRDEQGLFSALAELRLGDTPVLAACGGFQYVIREAARGFLPADTGEVFIRVDSCEVQQGFSVGGEHALELIPPFDTRSWYGRPRTTEVFACSYEVRSDSLGLLEAAGVSVGGWTSRHGPMLFRIAAHPFFVAAGFLPHWRTSLNHPHPLVVAFVRAAAVASTRNLRL
jgi:CTP synthase (UTP-ammonia lyase)